jgi:hypothetical protein
MLQLAMSYRQLAELAQHTSADSDHADRWRRLAEEARTLAENLTDPHSQGFMLQLAMSYRQLAELAQHPSADRLTDDTIGSDQGTQAWRWRS